MIGTSYISERSAEYVLVGRLTSILRQRYRYVIPLFPWAKREGSNLSLRQHSTHKFQVLAVYTRRPKLTVPEALHIAFTLNYTIVQGARMAKYHGIPTIAGCPIARNFFELSNCKQFVWVDLLDCLSEDVDPYILSDHRGTIRVEGHPPRGFTEDDVLRLVDTEAHWLSLSQFMEAVKQIKVTSGAMRYLGPFPHFGGYKPVYFLLA